MRTCPNCGEIVMNGEAYCPNCGTTFSKSSRENLINEFKNFYFYAFDGYNTGEYEFTMNSLSVVFGKYTTMSNSQKSRVKEMLQREWVVDLCCITVNNHGTFHRRAWEIIEEMDFDVGQCEGCECIYPAVDKHCIRCGKPLTWQY